MLGDCKRSMSRRSTSVPLQGLGSTEKMEVPLLSARAGSFLATVGKVTA
jgi:hypothetical protein